MAVHNLLQTFIRPGDASGQGDGKAEDGREMHISTGAETRDRARIGGRGKRGSSTQQGKVSQLDNIGRIINACRLRECKENKTRESDGGARGVWEVGGGLVTKKCGQTLNKPKLSLLNSNL